jgi:hypothetical protein
MADTAPTALTLHLTERDAKPWVFTVTQTPTGTLTGREPVLSIAHAHGDAASIVDIACTVQGDPAVSARAQVSASNAATIKAAVTFPARARSVTLAWTLTLTDPSADRIAIASGPLIYAATAGPDPA